MSQWRRAGTAVQKHPRVSMRRPVRITTVDPEIDPDSGRPFFRCVEETTANLSRGGAFVESWEPLGAGRRVVVAIDLTNGEELQLVGHVAWTRRRIREAGEEAVQTPGYGVEFSAGSKAELHRLEALLAPSTSARATDSTTRTTPTDPGRPTPPA